MTAPLLLDLTRLLPGPLAAKILGAMGWRVHRLLPPQGDPLARLAPKTHAWLNAEKTEEICDLKHPAGRARLAELVREATALIENNRPGVMERLGVGPDALLSINPRLVYVRLAGHPDPALRDAPGHDLTYLAAAGLLERLEAAWPHAQLADVTGALWAALAVLEGVRRGGGFYPVHLEIAPRVFAYPPIPYLDGSVVCYGVYPAAQGRVALAALEPHLWARFCQAAGKAAWRDAAFTPARPENPVWLEVIAWFRERPAEAWEVWAQRHALPLRAVRTGGVPGGIRPW
ncbi:CoA transferase [Marinithermus hydrothermalis]|uniref:L-carnitine dehydratase/bile acid-inducible protein F n=1 Tax=Marinithermus hydrothermalis (strain DSM 14884 / JCM 11576 / T1) TaxID=869210 RepID=F2NKP5_MARHT|nr:CoA transferase [Marinithermus hydrothermalis]AEB10808.1 L-carnitine dehydratase/bile acid-inducible protein F [Marinithermus hydrothermalis DSM 14884]